MISASVILILFILSVWDIKKQKIPIGILVAAGLAAVIFRIIFTVTEIAEFSFIGMMIAFIPGSIFLVLSFATREQIGYGDGIVLCMIGILCSFRKVMMILGIGLCLSSVVSMVLLILRKGDRYTTLPFLPFLWIGAVLEMIIEAKIL